MTTEGNNNKFGQETHDAVEARKSFSWKTKTVLAVGAGVPLAVLGMPDDAAAQPNSAELNDHAASQMTDSASAYAPAQKSSDSFSATDTFETADPEAPSYALAQLEGPTSDASTRQPSNSGYYVQSGQPAPVLGQTATVRDEADLSQMGVVREIATVQWSGGERRLLPENTLEKGGVVYDETEKGFEFAIDPVQIGPSDATNDSRPSDRTRSTGLGTIRLEFDEGNLLFDPSVELEVDGSEVEGLKDVQVTERGARSVGWELEDGGIVAWSESTFRLDNYTEGGSRTVMTNPPPTDETTPARAIEVSNIVYSENPVAANRQPLLSVSELPTHNKVFNALRDGKGLPESYASDKFRFNSIDRAYSSFIGPKNDKHYGGFEYALSAQVSVEELAEARRIKRTFGAGVNSSEIPVTAHVHYEAYPNRIDRVEKVLTNLAAIENGDFPGNRIDESQ